MITNTVTLEQSVAVTLLKGQIYLLAADGSWKLLAEGDVLPKGGVIMSPNGASFMGGDSRSMCNRPSLPKRVMPPRWSKTVR
ncbi:hypothetical protein [Aeromonas veronii]|uniref:hypothetical protein n=1 Tax=Aeromonas veronii TaxID=654 RepID=UPI003EC6B305